MTPEQFAILAGPGSHFQQKIALLLAEGISCKKELCRLLNCEPGTLTNNFKSAKSLHETVTRNHETVTRNNETVTRNCEPTRARSFPEEKDNNKLLSKKAEAETPPKKARPSSDLFCSSEPKATKPDLVAVEFEAFWLEWRKVLPEANRGGKKPAREAYRRSRMAGNSAEFLTEALQHGHGFNYNLEAGTVFEIHVSTWLNKERFNDDPVQIPAPPKQYRAPCRILEDLSGG